MERILVLDVAADSGGALTVLKQFYEKALSDQQNEYVFCVSMAGFSETDRIGVRCFPWVKKGWLHRMWFERVTAHRLIKKEKATRVLSLQNTLPSGVKIPSTLYLHQPLPFIDRRFSFRENRLFWLYQNVIGKMIYRSLRRADEVVVQTAWMKEAAMRKAGISAGKITLQAPPPPQYDGQPFAAERWDGTFFYPASAMAYKNHTLILKACAILQERGVDGFTVRFTLTPQELSIPEKLQGIVQSDGGMTHEQVMETYSRSALIFASYVETYGLPLAEARATGSPVLASDCPFCHEILDDYGSVRFFDPFNEYELADLMQQLLEEYRK